MMKSKSFKINSLILGLIYFACLASKARDPFDLSSGSKLPYLRAPETIPLEECDIEEKLSTSQSSDQNTKLNYKLDSCYNFKKNDWELCWLHSQDNFDDDDDEE